tara:strand:+ start:594 stop:1298 length:705 start_codon:yes stop_codon:yes gene_type:complete
MTKAVRVTVEATKAAKDIASKDIVIWREARKIGLNLADMVDANDDKARADYWKALGATITYGTHKAYWTAHNSSGRNLATQWAQVFVWFKKAKVDPELMFSGGTVPTVASVRALLSGRESVDAAMLKAALTGPNAKPFCLAVVKGAMPTIKKGANTKGKTTKADKATKKINAEAIAEAKADAAAIRSEAANDAKANTLASIVDFIAREADDTLVKAVRVACDQAAARLGAAAAI